MIMRALPMELDLDFATLVGEDFAMICWPDHGGGLWAEAGGLGVFGVAVFGDYRYATADKLELAAEGVFFFTAFVSQLMACR